MFFSIEQRVNNFKLYYQKKNTRPLLGFFGGSEYPLHRYKAPASLTQSRPLEPRDFIVEDYLADTDRLFDEHEKLGGDFMFAADAFWGIPWLEAILGCELIASHKTGSIHAEHLHSGTKLEKKSIANNPWVQKAVEFLDKTSRRSAGRYPLATTRMRGISDLLAIIYGNEMMVYKMIESPEEVKEVCEVLTQVWIDFARIQLDHIPYFHEGVGSFYYNMWAAGKAVWLQEDASALLSPPLYEEFILPCDKAIAAAFDGCFMHMHPGGFYPYKQLIDTDMTCVELHIDEGGPDAQELFDVHKLILSKKPLLIWGKLAAKDLDWIFSKLPVEGLAVMTTVDDPAESKYIWDKYINRR